MEALDLIIRNGSIADGTGKPRFDADVGIRQGRIVAVGPIPEMPGVPVIDAAGKIVAPGHVTQHAHYDAAIFWSPYCLDSGPQGVTSILNANCGFSIAPVRPQDRERTMAMLSTTEQIPVEQQRAALTWEWETFPEFMACLRRLPKSVNIMTYMPLNPLLIYVMGVAAAKSRQPTAAEMAEMHRLINEGMDHGAIGISASVMGEQGNSHVDNDGTPMPTDLLARETIVGLSRALIERGEGVVQLFSNVGPNGDRETSADVARAARGSGVRVVHNIIVPVEGHPEIADADLAWLNGLRAEGLDIFGATLAHHGWVENGIRDLDTAAGSMTGVRKIVACHDDGEIMALLEDPVFVADFSNEYIRDGAANGAGGFESQTVTTMGSDPALAGYVGRTLGEIADETGQTVVEVLCDLARRSRLDMGLKSASFAAYDGRIAATLLASPAITAGVSDGGAHTKSMSNGFYGTELLVRLVREQKVISLEEMHYQLSLKIAKTLGIHDRGAVRPGHWADLLIYDLDELFVDYSAFGTVRDMPTGDWRRETKAGGYAQVLVNGEVIFDGGKWTRATPGTVIEPTAAAMREAAE